VLFKSNVHHDCFFDLGRSGCGLAWEYFFGSAEMPMFLRHVQDRDLWKFNLKDTKAFCSTFYSLPFDFNVYDDHNDLSVYKNAIDEGKIILRHIEKVVENDAKDATYCYLSGHKIKVINSRNNVSELGERLCKDDPSIPFAAVFHWASFGCWKVSLRSVNRIDTSVIAKEYGGGGHPNASAFNFYGDIKELFTLKDQSISKKRKVEENTIVNKVNAETDSESEQLDELSSDL
jgi:oligoribonuclease NrnB/cAMP/cGMP phosphodiesterase (DHH superfamily)